MIVSYNVKMNGFICGTDVALSISFVRLYQ